MKKWLWGIVIIAMLVGIPSLYERIAVEDENRNYEVAIPYDEIEEMVTFGQQVYPKEEVYRQLHQAGVHSVGIEPMTISDLESEDLGIISEVSQAELISDYPLISTHIENDVGMYFKVFDEDHYGIQLLVEAFNNEYELQNERLKAEGRPIERDLSVNRFTVGDDTIYFFPYAYSKSKPIGYDIEIVEELIDAGFSIVPRLSNNYPYIEEENYYIYEQLAQMRELGAEHLLFTGTEVPGTGDVEIIRAFAENIDDLGYNIVTVEFNPQAGMQTLLATGDFDVIRLLSVDYLEKNNFEEQHGEMEKFVRGVKERNIRMFYINLLGDDQRYHSLSEGIQGIEGAVTFIEKLHERVPDQFKAGSAQPFSELVPSTLVKIISLVGVVAFITLFMQTALPSLTKLVTAGMALLVLLQLVTGSSIVLQGVALITSIVGAMFAVLAIKDVRDWKDLILQYVKAVAIAFVAIWFIVLLLYGTEYLVKIAQFRGVKVLAALPMLIGALLLFRDKLKWFFSLTVRYWHVAIMVVLGAVLLFYVGRTGNEGVALPLEMQFRQMLENILYVRPRTTEFLIGFPFFFLGLYLMKEKKAFAPIFLLLGFIAFSSMISTFTHLHTPFLISGLRTIYSIVFGAGIGLVLIAVYKVVENRLYPWVKARWSE
ncbi:DUF5693 family protein [Desertibacillus haloalkaliphilus]|uniref:DUF5693 family protein n=1 Tax=Desertibacillus haloalkaliphilus TaxID=1328930 RepID=UPI001C276AED|nr:DUF5693 family protein [Desertibacillus haloalkaliphilus]MBU8905972.1 hypothetical protein [Desertibacillus haloalkaliphilus]